MRRPLAEEEIEELQKAFDSYDCNNDGFITMGELSRLLRLLGQNPTEAEILTIIQELDTNTDWMVSFDEFLFIMATKFEKQDTEEEVREAYRVFDVNGNGFVSAEELCTVAKNLGENLTEEEATEMISSARGGDGAVIMTVDDFIRLMDPKN